MYLTIMEISRLVVRLIGFGKVILGCFFMMMIICKQFIISFFEEYTKFKKLNNKIFKKLKEVETKKDEAWLLIKFYFCINLGHCILSLGLHLVLHSSSQGMFLLHYACHVAFCMSLCIIIYICSCILPFVGFFFFCFFNNYKKCVKAYIECMISSSVLHGV